jgi:hypothetical protein
LRCDDPGDVVGREVQPHDERALPAQLVEVGDLEFLVVLGGLVPQERPGVAVLGQYVCLEERGALVVPTEDP